ncbi:hypothetical protein RhiirC2_779228 [Rhizophagus irregularis]|uniref:Uncharacterized protein n=1 Tax=Rhizophagus irregularis TaxID=588596 RepID=A0A2N1NAC1_9GLOM|nr:hypothetical protein RhiirC2_779228 [Rhizophagus irregularis]
MNNLKNRFEDWTRTRQYADGKRECRNGVSTHRNSRNAVRNIRKTSNETPSAIGTKTTAHKEGKYCDQVSGLRNVPKINKVCESNDLRYEKR